MKQYLQNFAVAQGTWVQSLVRELNPTWYGSWSSLEWMIREREKQKKVIVFYNLTSEWHTIPSTVFCHQLQIAAFQGHLKFLNSWEHQTTLPVSKETCMLVKKQQLELCMEQLTCSGLRKEYDKAVYCHPVYLTYMQSTSCETLGWMNHKLESRLPGEISATSDIQMTTPLWQKVKKN